MRFILITFLAIGLGVMFGYLSDNTETAQLILSIICILLLLVIIVRAPLLGMIVWLFFMVFIDSWVEIPMGRGIPDLSFSRFAIALLFVFLLAQGAIGKFRFVPLSWSEVFIVLTVAGIASAAPLTPGRGAIGVIQWSITMHFTPLIIYFFAKNLVKNRSDMTWVFMAIALLGFVSGLYTIYEYTTGDVLFLPKDKQAFRFFRGRDENGIRLIVGIMGGSGQMGRALAATIPVTFYLFLERRQLDIRKLFLAFMLVIQFVGIIIPLSRTPWLALILALLVMQFFYPQFRKVFAVIAFVGLIVVWGTWDQVSQTQAASRLGTNEESLVGREVRWETGLNMLRARPIRGWGFGRFEDISGRFRTDGSRQNFDAVESDYLHLAVGGGLIALIPYLMFMAILISYSLRLYFKARAPNWQGFIKPETLTVFWAVMICLMVTSYTAKQVQPVIKLMTFAVAGSIVGTHEIYLRRDKRSVKRDAGSIQPAELPRPIS